MQFVVLKCIMNSWRTVKKILIEKKTVNPWSFFPVKNHARALLTIIFSYWLSIGKCTHYYFNRPCSLNSGTENRVYKLERLYETPLTLVSERTDLSIVFVHGANKRNLAGAKITSMLIDVHLCIWMYPFIVFSSYSYLVN